MKTTKKILSLILALAMICTLGLTSAFALAQDPVFGPDDDASTTAPDDGYHYAFGLTKYMIVDQTATIPEETFKFNISQGTAVAGTVADTNGGETVTEYTGPITPGILPGVKQVTVDFDSNSTTTDGTATDGITDDVTKKYATGQAFFDFSGVKYEVPGVYRYTISELDEGHAGITYATNTYTLDVVVGFKNPTDTALSILGYYYYDNNTSGVPTGNKIDPEDVTFPNKLRSNDLTISKTVAGQLGDRTKYFDFSVSLGGTNGYTFDFELYQGTTKLVPGTDDDAIEAILGTGSGYAPANATTPAGLPADAKTDFHLKDGQKIVILGLPEATEYTIEEASYATSGYTTTATCDDTTSTVSSPTVSNTTPNSMKMDTAVAYTNTKDTTAPTGVILQVLPFALLVLLAGCGIGLLTVSKRKRAAR